MQTRQQINEAIKEKDLNVLMQSSLINYSSEMLEEVSNKDISITFCDCCGDAFHSDSNDIWWLSNIELIEEDVAREKLGKLNSKMITCICDICLNDQKPDTLLISATCIDKKRRQLDEMLRNK